MTPTRTQRLKRRLLNLDKQRGIIGNPNLSGRERIQDSITGKYWVRPEKSSGSFSSPVLLPLAQNAVLPAAWNLVVELGYDTARQLVIKGVDLDAAKQQGANPALLNPSETGAVQIEQIKHLYCRKHPTTPYAAYVYAGLVISNGTVIDWLGGSINLITYQPSAGNHCYAGVYLSDSGALGVSASTPQSVSSALVTADLQEVIDGMPAGAVPLRAFVLSGDEADFTDTPALSKDLRSAWVVL